MRHVLTFLSKGVGFKLVALLLTVGIGVVIFQLSGAYKGHALNVHTEIKANPPGIAKIIDQTGQPSSSYPDIGSSGENQPSGTEPTSQAGIESVTQPGAGSATQPGTGTTPPGDNTQPEKPPISLITDIIDKITGGGGAPPPSPINLESNRPTILTINTDIDFGTVFPEETVQGHFIVYLTGTGNATDNETWDTGPFTAVTYNVTMTDNVSPYKDMRPYLIVQRDPGELDSEPDDTANGTDNDYFAIGSLNVTDNDTFDKWFVTLEVPDDTGDYWIKILIEVP